jgi:hypothetical protein
VGGLQTEAVFVNGVPFGGVVAPLAFNIPSFSAGLVTELVHTFSKPKILEDNKASIYRSTSRKTICLAFPTPIDPPR